MDFTRLRPDDSSAMDEFWSLLTDVHRHDQPGHPLPQRKAMEVNIANLRTDVRQEFHLVHAGGRPTGCAWLMFPVLDNTHLVFANGTVAPDRRRRGAGAALLELALRRGREENRTTIAAHTAEPVPGGAPRTTDGREFLCANGFDIVHSTRDWRVDLPSIDGKVETDLLNEALPHAWEYDLVIWTGPTPDEHLTAVTALANRFVSEVPFGDLALEDKHVDVERRRATEALDAVKGVTSVSTYARHRATGELVAHSVISVGDETPEFGHQEVTLVHPEHRGHRLGTIVKIQNHRLLRREFPGARTVLTSVAEINTHMLAINERLGFTEVDRQLDFQRRI